jgi:hypothetical protein
VIHKVYCSKERSPEYADFPDKTPLMLYLRSVKQAVQVVKQLFPKKDSGQGTLYLVSMGPPDGDTSLDYEQITTIYPGGNR